MFPLFKRLPTLTSFSRPNRPCIEPTALLLAVSVGLGVALSSCAPSGSGSQPTASLPNAAPVSTNRPSEALKTVIRIGYQKYGTLFVVKARGNLDERLKREGVSVQWLQFPAGPQMLEALNAGSIDYGSTGETPPILAQAAGAPLVYVANEPADPTGEAILVSKNSAIKTVADLKGKKVALNKGSNVHYLLVQALAKAGLKYTDIQTSYLAPADGRAAFEKGDVDAWVIWEPYLTVAQKALSARVLQDGQGLVANRQFYLAAKPFAEQYPDRVKVILDETQNVDSWSKAHPEDAARILSPQIGIDVATLTTILKGRPSGLKLIQPDVVAYQQQIADSFVTLGLVPKPIVVKDVAQAPN